ncbi:YdcF family protein [Jeotgalibaca porci]|uniref:YdcF family protein n=1 Tax=Jeotgalibaca porci TaxID=1868793 RepID=A0A6G7WGJ2_9LACT|nr:YdcF family protein [Jeotgalibaca porci]QIK51362.1 YdcF family protein [Jeotgalibaca porci]
MRKEKIKEVIFNHQEFILYSEEVNAIINGWAERHRDRFLQISSDIDPKVLIHDIAEDKSTTTHENMMFCKRIIDARTENASIAYSTTNYHVFRSGFLAQEVGVKADGIGARTKWYFWPNAMISEVVGVFSRQSKRQWLFIAGLILFFGLVGYAYTLIY